MDYIGLLTVVGVNIGLIAWLRSDIKDFEKEIRGWKEESRKDFMDFKMEISREMKDFHGRLCSLEARWHGEKYGNTEE